ncbi:MFS transporter [Candidatus Woesearchaeota archaeon]|nr:MFS transporter [Candidatus Woesearchaeota archaeon]
MRENIKQFIIGAIIVSLATTAGYIIGPVEVRFISSLTTSTTLVGLTFGIGTIFFALLSVWLGRLSDRIGRNRLVIIGVGLGIVYPLLYASTFNVFQYMGVKVAWAFSSVATGPVFMAYLQDILKDLPKKGHYIGLVYSAQSILGSGAALLGGVLSDTYGLRAPYIAMSIVFALATIISIRELKFKDKPLKKKVEKKELLHGIKYLFKKPTLIFYFIENTAFSLNWGIKAMLWPLIIYGMTNSDTITGSVFATMGIVAFFMLLFVGKLVDKIGPFRSTTISFLFLGISGIALVLTDNIAVFWIGAAFFAIGEATHGPAQAVILTDHVESKVRGEILGLDALFDGTFNTISPFIAGILLNFWLAQQVLAVYITLFFAALVLFNIVYFTKIRTVQ